MQRSVSNAPLRLGALVRPELIFHNLTCADGPTALRAFAGRIAERGVVDDADELYRRLLEREKLGSTALGHGVAVPHCKLDGLKEVVVAIGLCQHGIEFAAEDRDPVRLLFLVISPSAEPAAHLQSLAAISRWVKEDSNVERILVLEDAESIVELLHQSTE